MKITKKILILMGFVLPSCSITKSFFPERNYFDDKQQAPLKIPPNLQATTLLKPMYVINDGEFANKDNAISDPKPPQLVELKD